jgi:hypothetical protein
MPEKSVLLSLHVNAPAHSSGDVSEFLAKRGIYVLSRAPCSLDAMKGTGIEAVSSIQQTNERTEGDTRRISRASDLLHE